MNFVLLLIVITTLSACAVINEPYYYNEVVIRNNASEILRNVKIQSMETNRMFSCANVPPGAQCSDKFQKRKYLGTRMSLFRIYQGKEKKIDDVVLNISETINKETPFRGVLVVNADGSLNIFVEQGRH